MAPFPITFPCTKMKNLASRLIEHPILGVLPSSVSAKPKSLMMIGSKQAKKQTRKRQQIYFFCILWKCFRSGGEENERQMMNNVMQGMRVDNPQV